MTPFVLGEIKDVHIRTQDSRELQTAKKLCTGQKGEVAKVILNLVLAASQKADAAISR